MDVVQANVPFTAFPFFFPMPISGLRKLQRTLSSVKKIKASLEAVIVVVTYSLSLPGPHILRHIFLLGLMIHGAMDVCGGNYWLDMPFFLFFLRTNLIKRAKIPGNFSSRLQSDATQNTLPPKNLPKNTKTKYAHFLLWLSCNPQAENKVGLLGFPHIKNGHVHHTFSFPFSFCLFLLEDFLALMHTPSLRLCCLQAANLTSGGPDSSGFQLFYCW